MSKNTQHFNNVILSSLNDAQREAVNAPDTAILVVAGAGSGKTRVITARIANLILNKNVHPTAIVALTFTNKAAIEMKERIFSFLGPLPTMPFIGTFHSYCLRILKNNAHLLRKPFLTILDEDDQHKLLTTLIQKYAAGKKISVRNIAYAISLMKNQAMAEDTSEYSFVNQYFFKEIFAAYEREKGLSKALDFDDLLLETLHLFTSQPEFKQAFQHHVRHVLVDEYQDTNTIQHSLLKHMTLNNDTFNIDSVCIVGDEDQSIYSWRGATIANIMNFNTDFPDARLIKIEQNYRSAQPILATANHVIKNNKQRNPKTLWSAKEAQNRVQGLTCVSEYQESDAITQLVKVAGKKETIKTIAILYRTHYQSRALEEGLIRQSLPYKIIGGIQFYERKEIKDILAYLRLIANPFDRASFMRVINCPTRGLGDKFEELFFEQWNEQPFLTFSQVAAQLIEQKKVVKTKKEALEKFIAVFAGYEHNNKPTVIVEQVIHKISYIQYLKDEYPQPEALEKIENLKELLHATAFFEEKYKETATLAAFLDDITLMQEKAAVKKGDEHDTVLLMTLHAAKGLEFDLVILTGLEEGVLPSSRSLNDSDAIEEERRLFYVGITRAKEYLLISHARYRYTFGTMADQTKSRFLAEIPSSLAPLNDASYWQAPQFAEFFALWLGTKTVAAQPKKIITFGAANKPSPQPIQTAPVPGKFKKHQSVRHKKFGLGTIQAVEPQEDEETTYLKIQFKAGLKKIDAKFIEAA
jgi:DNA helicase-2/ATP-dependent DNA helicase PcrA